MPNTHEKHSFVLGWVAIVLLLACLVVYIASDPNMLVLP